MVGDFRAIPTVLEMSDARATSVPRRHITEWCAFAIIRRKYKCADVQYLAQKRATLSRRIVAVHFIPLRPYTPVSYRVYTTDRLKLNSR